MMLAAFFRIVLSPLDGKKRCTATSKQVRKCRDDDDQRKTQADATKRRRTLARDTGNVDTIYDIV